MVYNWLQGRGSILADEMGLGKTLQVYYYLGAWLLGLLMILLPLFVLIVVVDAVRGGRCWCCRAV